MSFKFKTTSARYLMKVEIALNPCPKLFKKLQVSDSTTKGEIFLKNIVEKCQRLKKKKSK